MKIKRDEYLKELIDAQWDGQIKVITGLRRSGKSYLLKTLFRDYLRRERGVDGDLTSDGADSTRTESSTSRSPTSCSIRRQGRI